MKIISSYRVRIYDAGRATFQPTINYYRAAFAYLVNVYERDWDTLSAIPIIGRQRITAAERIIHTTRFHAAKYDDFDKNFPKIPTYLRRAAQAAALCTVTGYHTHHDNWEKGGRQGGEPQLTANQAIMPIFYKTGMYILDKEKNTAQLKLYNGEDWKWVTVRLRKTDLKYLEKYWSHVKPFPPVLEKDHKKYYLRFAFEEKGIKLSDTSIEKRLICAVDLGLNTDAVCSIMSCDGTILKRKFINFPEEKDQLYTVLNRIKKSQREHGLRSVSGRWSYANQMNDELAKKIASSITEFAVENSADCIVFERLDFQGKKLNGANAQKISLWKKNGIQHYVEHSAHRCGIRISRVCAWGTSRLAYDGSGPLVRNEKNHSLAVFANGKQYNCDLNASYNIGARYFIRELLKPLLARVRSQLEAEIPEVGRRTLCTLDTLRKLHSFITIQDTSNIS